MKIVLDEIDVKIACLKSIEEMFGVKDSEVYVLPEETENGGFTGGLVIYFKEKSFTTEKN